MIVFKISNQRDVNSKMRAFKQILGSQIGKKILGIFLSEKRLISHKRNFQQS